MSVAKTIEITSGSPESFDDAIKLGIKKAAESVDNIQAAWVADQQVLVKGKKITEYRVQMKITFIVGSQSA